MNLRGIYTNVQSDVSYRRYVLDFLLNYSDFLLTKQ